MNRVHAAWMAQVIKEDIEDEDSDATGINGRPRIYDGDERKMLKRQRERKYYWAKKEAATRLQPA